MISDAVFESTAWARKPSRMAMPMSTGPRVDRRGARQSSRSPSRGRARAPRRPGGSCRSGAGPWQPQRGHEAGVEADEIEVLEAGLAHAVVDALLELDDPEIVVGGGLVAAEAGPAAAVIPEDQGVAIGRIRNRAPGDEVGDTADRPCSLSPRSSSSSRPPPRHQPGAWCSASRAGCRRRHRRSRRAIRIARRNGNSRCRRRVISSRSWRPNGSGLLSATM